MESNEIYSIERCKSIIEECKLNIERSKNDILVQGWLLELHQSRNAIDKINKCIQKIQNLRRSIETQECILQYYLSGNNRAISTLTINQIYNERWQKESEEYIEKCTKQLEDGRLGSPWYSPLISEKSESSNDILPYNPIFLETYQSESVAMKRSNSFCYNETRKLENRKTKKPHNEIG